MLSERPLIQKKLHQHYRNIIFDLGAVLVYFNAREILADVFKAEPVVPYEILPMFYDTELPSLS